MYLIWPKKKRARFILWWQIFCSKFRPIRRWEIQFIQVWSILIYFDPIWSKKVNYLDFILCTLKMRTSTLFFFNLRHRHVKPIERWHPNDSSSINMYLSPHWPRWRLFKRNNPISKKEVKNLLLIISEIREIVNLTLKTY